MWASLPCDLLVEIFCLLETTAVVRCAGACRPWRRAIIANASRLQLHPDRFNPNLLIGFFSRNYWSMFLARLRYVPGPFEDLFSPSYRYDKNNAHYTSIGFFMPWAATGGVDVAQYDEPLSSRDGFLLLRRCSSSESSKVSRWGEGSKVSDLCLCNPLAGSCRFLPAAAFGEQQTCTYVLVTGHDYGDSAVRVVALRREEDVKRGVIYQIFSSASGEWGPVKRSIKFEKGINNVDMRGEPGDVVVCRGSVYCLVRLISRRPCWSARRCVFAMDVRTERTWTLEVPEKYVEVHFFHYNCFVLATSEDGWLSLIAQKRDLLIEVLRQAIDVPNLQISGCLKEDNFGLVVRGFCSRSGCLFGYMNNKDILITSTRAVSVRQGDMVLAMKPSTRTRWIGRPTCLR